MKQKWPRDEVPLPRLPHRVRCNPGSREIRACRHARRWLPRTGSLVIGNWIGGRHAYAAPQPHPVGPGTGDRTALLGCRGRTMAPARRDSRLAPPAGRPRALRLRQRGSMERRARLHPCGRGGQDHRDHRRFGRQSAPRRPLLWRGRCAARCRREAEPHCQPRSLRTIGLPPAQGDGLARGCRVCGNPGDRCAGPPKG